MNNRKIVKLLKQLPEVKLGLIDMLWQVVDDSGRVMPDKVLFYQKELDECMQEAKDYVVATRKAIICLKSLITGVKQQSVDLDGEDL